MTIRRCGGLLPMLAAGILALSGLPAPAGDGRPSGATMVTAPAPVPSEPMTIKKIMQTGGGVMYVLAGASFLTLAFTIYFFVVIRVSQVAPRLLRREIVEDIRAGRVDDARRACEYRPCPLSSVVLAAVNYLRDAPKADPGFMKSVMESEGARQADSIQGQAQYLLDIAVLSPMLGLLGTVVGMLEAFNAVALEGAVAKPIMLAMGVSRALVATAFGLIVGIPAMGFYGYFRRKASKVVAHLEVAAMDALAALSTRIAP
jgi:biopolymer transport protein ExbB